jgi:thioredoxin-related protein
MSFTSSFFRPAALALLAGFFLTGLFSCTSGRKTSSSSAAYNDSADIHWMSMTEAEAAMQKAPRKVWVDVYTDWCGWCKVMDRKTFSNPDVIRYINQHFYAVKLNAETRDSLRFQGVTYGLAEDGRSNALAVKLLNGQMGYPTSLIMDENFVHAYSFMGYQTVPQAETILKYFDENWYRKLTWDQFTSQYTPQWRERVLVDSVERIRH